MKKATFLAMAALSLAAATTGCIGKTHSFCMFNGILNWNKQVSDNEWVNELIFLGSTSSRPIPSRSSPT